MRTVPPVVDATWVRQRRGDGLVLADVRWYLDGRSGRAAYETGHLPDAVFVDLDRWLAGHAGPGAGRHPLPDPAVFAEGMAGLGVADDDVVVAYDDQGGVIAARLVWMLRATGRAAALLDGGMAAWAAAGGALSTEEVHRPAAVFTTRPWPAEHLATTEDAEDRANIVLDARDAARYRGEVEPVDPRAGHVPGALNLACRQNLGPDGRLLPVAALRERFAAVGVSSSQDAQRVVSYCGSGVTACHTLVVLEHAGLGRGRLFPGSWSQYSSDPGRVAATGDQPG